MLVRFAREQLHRYQAKARWRRMMRQHQIALLKVLDRTSSIDVDDAGPVEVHILCGRDTLVDGIAMLKSFYRFAT